MIETYDPKNWKVGDRVTANPNYKWIHKTNDDMKKLLQLRGEVIRVESMALKVMWDDGYDVYYSYADESLINLSRCLPDELFEI